MPGADADGRLRVELILAQPTGVAEVHEGTAGRRVSIELRTTSVARSGDAPREVIAVDRGLHGLDGDELHYRLAMAAVGQPLTHHLEQPATARCRPGGERRPGGGTASAGLDERVTSPAMGRRSARVLTRRLRHGDLQRSPDELAVEEPLAIELDGTLVATTMRTPGHDFELAVGFCLTEGLLAGRRRALAAATAPTGPARRAGYNLVTVDTGGAGPAAHAPPGPDHLGLRPVRLGQR